MINLYSHSSYKTKPQGRSFTRVTDLETVLSVSDIKQYLKIDSDYTVDDNLISDLREANFKIVEDYIHRSLTVNDIVANYASVSNNVLLPYSYPTSITSIVANGVTLTVDDDYTLFDGRVSFTNGIGYPKNIVFTYQAQSDLTANIKTSIMKMIWIDYDNSNDMDKGDIMKKLRSERVKGWI